MTAMRVRLNPAEWAAVLDLAGTTPPPGFAARRPATITDIVMGIFRDGRPVPAVAGALAALARPVLGIQVEISVDGAGLRAFVGVTGRSGVGLVTMPGGGVELSSFPAELLTRELVRLVPETAQGAAEVARALGAPQDRPVPTGVLPLAALEVAGEPSGGELELSSTEAALAGEVVRRSLGVLRCLVVGTRPDGSTAAGQVVWLATDGDEWIGLRPEPNATHRTADTRTPGADEPPEVRRVRLVPARRTELGTWLAPHVAAVLR